MKVFADVGFGWVKIENEEGIKVMFPSIAGEKSASGFNIEAQNSLGIETKNGKWLFGDSARLQSVTASHSQDSNWVLSDVYEAAILLGICELSKADKLNIELMLALPFQDYQNETLRANLINRLEGEHLVKRHKDHQRINIQFGPRYGICPQNAVTMFAHVLDHKGKFSLDPNRPRYSFGSVNIGSQTAEFYTATFDSIPGGGFKLNGVGQVQTKTEPAGTYKLTRIVRPLLQNEVGRIQLTDHDIFEAIRSGKIYSGSREIILNGLLEEPIKQYQKSIRDLCSNVWNDQPPVTKDELFGLIVSGGGAYLVADDLRKWHKDIWVSDNPQWDVIQGMKRFRRLLNG